MTADLRANTDIMRTSATSISDGGNIVSQSAGKINTLSNKIGNAYDGQLREKIVPILSSVSNEGFRLQSRSQEVSKSLLTKATEIDVTMQENVGLVALSTALTIGSPLRAFFAKVLGLGVISSLLKSIGIKTDRSYHTNIDQKLTTTSLTPVSSTKQKDYHDFAKTALADDNRRTLSEVPNPSKESDAVALYYRGDGSSSSNCTWYAASAVETAHGIPLNSGKYGETGTFSKSLGHGGQWAEHAQAAIDPKNPSHEQYKEYQPYISSVDTKPEPGSVYSIPGTENNSYGHVMFVEEAKLIEANGTKSWQIVVSEENWGGSDGYSGAKEVQMPGHPEVKRWTRTITIPADDSGRAQTSGRFIHFVNSN